jgi:glycosyltransferase involved in cell wall biosynthesis
MHIGFITPEYPQFTPVCGGLGTSLKILAESLVKNDIKVSVFLFNNKKDFQSSENGIDFYFIKKKNFFLGTWFFNRKYFQNKVQKIINNHNIDLIESPDWTGITAFMKFTVPLIIRLHGSDTFFCYLEKREQKLKHFIYEKMTMKHADGIISPSLFAAKISSQLFSLKKKQIKIIHYGLSLQEFMNKAPLNFDRGLILYYGSIVRKKGVFELPQIFKEVLIQVPGAKLLLIGKDCRDQFSGCLSTWEVLQEELEDELKDKITYIKSIPYDAVRSYIQKANVCVFPSFAETLGMVIIESMAMNKAVVTSDYEWSREIIDDGIDGFLADPKKHKEFAKKIIDLIEDTDLTKRTGLNAIEKVYKKFDIQEKIAENINYYNEAISCYHR